jgi:hypothetical protein
MKKSTRNRYNFMNIASPAIIIAGVRTGGTYLAHCLSNHPRIFCDRGEALNGRNKWFRLCKNQVRVLDCLIHQPFYHVSMCKLTYAQALNKAVWRYIVTKRPHVIHLVRQNVLRQVVSLCINNAQRDRPAHTFVDLPAAHVRLEPQQVLAIMHKITEQANGVRKRLEKLPHVIELEYTSLIGANTKWEDSRLTFLQETTCQSICEFLGVPVMALGAELRRLNPQPLPEIITNWREVKAAVELHQRQRQGRRRR